MLDAPGAGVKRKRLTPEQEVRREFFMDYLDTRAGEEVEQCFMGWGVGYRFWVKSACLVSWTS